MLTGYYLSKAAVSAMRDSLEMSGTLIELIKKAFIKNCNAEVNLVRVKRMSKVAYLVMCCVFFIIRFALLRTKIAIFIHPFPIAFVLFNVDSQPLYKAADARTEYDQTY